jgi:hypothetical protein
MLIDKKTVYAFILLMSISGLQCSNIRNLSFRNSGYKAIYIDQFKLVYLQQVLKRSYNDSRAIKEIIDSDHSGFKEPILTEEDYKYIDYLTFVDNEKMKIDSLNGSRRAEGAQGKMPLGYILNRINSKWLDSIAIKRYKLLKGRQME